MEPPKGYGRVCQVSCLAALTVKSSETGRLESLDRLFAL